MKIGYITRVGYVAGASWGAALTVLTYHCVSPIVKYGLGGITSTTLWLVGSAAFIGLGYYLGSPSGLDLDARGKREAGRIQTNQDLSEKLENTVKKVIENKGFITYLKKLHDVDYVNEQLAVISHLPPERSELVLAHQDKTGKTAIDLMAERPHPEFLEFVRTNLPIDKKLLEALPALSKSLQRIVAEYCSYASYVNTPKGTSWLFSAFQQQSYPEVPTISAPKEGAKKSAEQRKIKTC